MALVDRIFKSTQQRQELTVVPGTGVELPVLRAGPACSLEYRLCN